MNQDGCHLHAYASPQLEHGYIRIANELFDAILRARLKYSTQTVLLAVVRKTYGYGKKEDDVSASQLGDACSMSRQHVTTALNELAAMNIIHKRPGRYGAIIGVNKDHSKWTFASPNLGQVDSPEVGQVNESRTSPGLGHPSESRTFASPNLGQVDSPNLGHTKDNLPKEKKTTSAPSEKISLGADGVWENIPEALRASWVKAYPALSLDAELAKAAAWIISNPNNRKRNFSRFLTNWLARAQDKAPRHVQAKQPSSADFDYWTPAGFEDHWIAQAYGCTAKSAWQYEGGKRVRRDEGEGWVDTKRRIEAERREAACSA